MSARAVVPAASPELHAGGEGTGTLRRWSRWAEPTLVVVALGAFWQAVSVLNVLPSEDFPPATAILQALVNDLQTSELWAAVGASMESWLLGMLLVVSIGVPVGMLLGASSIPYRMSYLTLEFIRTIPGIAALPLLLFTYGIGQELTVSFVVLAALWPLLIQAMYGMRDIDPVAIETAKVYGVGRIRRLLLVDLPSCLPYLSTGLRLSGTFALIFAIATSLIVGGEGLGAEMAQAAIIGDRPLLYARVLLTGLIGLVVALGLTTLERRTLRWHVSQRGAQS